MRLLILFAGILIGSRVAKEGATAKNARQYGLFRCRIHYARTNSASSVYNAAGGEMNPNDKTAVGIVDVLVQGPDGIAIAKAKLDVYATFDVWRDAPRFSENTDARGHFTMSLNPGIHRLLAVVRGVGFGSTGIFEVLAEKTASATVPPMARFAAIEGIADPELLQAGTEVRVGTEDWSKTAAKLDAKGHFVLQNVTPGQHWMVLSAGEHRIDIEPICIDVAPGQHLTGVHPHKAVAEPQQREVVQAVDAHKPVHAIRGDVVDEAGTAINGARVFAIDGTTSLNHADQPEQLILSGTTGADGKFDLKRKLNGEELNGDEFDFSFMEIYLIVDAQKHKAGGKRLAVGQYAQQREQFRTALDFIDDHKSFERAQRGVGFGQPGGALRVFEVEIIDGIRGNE